eukprot:947538-Prorocentrum_minimum.AAC.1
MDIPSLAIPSDGPTVPAIPSDGYPILGYPIRRISHPWLSHPTDIPVRFSPGACCLPTHTCEAQTQARRLTPATLVTRPPWKRNICHRNRCDRCHTLGNPDMPVTLIFPSQGPIEGGERAYSLVRGPSKEGSEHIPWSRANRRRGASIFPGQ